MALSLHFYSFGNSFENAKNDLLLSIYAFKRDMIWDRIEPLIDVVCVDALMQVDVEYFLILMGCREHVPPQKTCLGASGDVCGRYVVTAESICNVIPFRTYAVSKYLNISSSIRPNLSYPLVSNRHLH